MNEVANNTKTYVEGYDKNGVVFPLRVFSENETANFRKEFELIETVFGGNLRYARNLHFYTQWAYNLCLRPEILDYVAPILGSELAVLATLMLTKYPRTSDYIGWHQDGLAKNNWGGEEHSLTVWLALTESNKQNGCMQVVAGTHKNSKFEHVDAADKNNILYNYGPEIVMAVDEEQALNLELKPGEISIHHQNIIHGSKPNTSDIKRTGFAIRYIKPQFGVNMDLVYARGKKRYQHNNHINAPEEFKDKNNHAAYKAFLEKRIINK
jgi:non-haem Fe2+, alpha-ketoglutarate-dependent halogenase